MQDTCARTVYTVSKVDPTGSYGIHYRAPDKYSDVFFFFFTVTKMPMFLIINIIS